MSRPRIGLLAAFILVLVLATAPQADAQSALANCKYYTKTQQDFEQGLAYCRQCIEDEPENPEAHFFGAWCLAESGEWEAAWTSFEWLIEREEHKDKKVRKHSTMAAQRVSKYYAEHFNKGVEYLNEGIDRYPQALEEFHVATQIDPRKAGGLLNLGFTRSQLDDADGALEAFRRAIEVDPDNETAFEYLSVALESKRTELMDAETVDEAALAEVTTELKTTLEKVLAANPANDAALLQLGDIAMAEGDEAGALSLIQRAIEVDPDNVVKLYNIAVGQYAADNFEAAAATFKLVSDEEDDPDSDLWRDAMYNRGLCLKSLEDYQGGLEVALELLEASSESQEYHSLASQMYVKLGDLMKANEHMEKVMALQSAESGGTNGE